MYDGADTRSRPPGGGGTHRPTILWGTNTYNTKTMKIEATQNKKTYSILLLGAPKVGKTTLATQFPRPYIIDLDGNMDGAVDYVVRHKLKTDVQWETVNVENGKPVPRADRYNRFIKLLYAGLNSKEFDTVIVDSTTALNEVLIDRVRVLQGRPIAPPMSGEPGKIKDGQLEIQDWGAFAGLWYTLITDAKTYGKHLIFNSHTVIEKDVSGAVREIVNVPGKTSGYIAGLFSDVWMLTKVDEFIGGKMVTNRYIQQTPASPSQNMLGLGTSAWEEPKKLLNLETLMADLGLSKP